MEIGQHTVFASRANPKQLDLRGEIKMYVYFSSINFNFSAWENILEFKAAYHACSLCEKNSDFLYTSSLFDVLKITLIHKEPLSGPSSFV